jgi:hypothetical protein
MRKFLLTAAAVCGLCVGAVAVRAADTGKDKEIKGVLIDNACAAKTDGEEKAANHPKSCAMKEGCAKSGFAVMSGKKVIKLDDAGNDKAKEYLGVKENATKVIVTGTLSDDGKTIHVTDIKPQKKAA